MNNTIQRRLAEFSKRMANAHCVIAMEAMQ